MADAAPNGTPSTVPVTTPPPADGVLPGLIVTVTKGADPSGLETR